MMLKVLPSSTIYSNYCVASERAGGSLVVPAGGSLPTRVRPAVAHASKGSKKKRPSLQCFPINQGMEVYSNFEKIYQVTNKSRDQEQVLVASARLIK
jgi:hypothetical protein